ncbi:hypothetical protein H4R99_007884 [Coemansia sp. RSA 1722]|nr:hypothetical protein IWW45_002392 [Coemansia sp. RSA 485]KAJ2588199.1 hypothetical protein H4R99_007884 [Coemansia sp. RSA 1722]
MANNPRRSRQRGPPPVIRRRPRQAPRVAEPRPARNVAQAQTAASSDTDLSESDNQGNAEEERIDELVSRFPTIDYPTDDDSDSSFSSSSGSSSSSSTSLSQSSLLGMNSGRLQDGAQRAQVHFDREESVTSDDSRSSGDFITINTQFSPSTVRRRRNINPRPPNASANEAGSGDNDSSSSGGDDNDNEVVSSQPIVIDTTQRARPGSSVQLVMDPMSPLSLSRPPPNEPPSAGNSPSSKRSKRKLSLLGHPKKEDKGVASESGADKRLRSEGTSNGSSNVGASAETATRSRIMFKCAVCLDTPDPAVFVHPCGHVFCEACAQGAVQSTRKCPVCRHQMRARDIRVLQFRVAGIKR